MAAPPPCCPGAGCEGRARSARRRRRALKAAAAGDELQREDSGAEFTAAGSLPFPPAPACARSGPEELRPPPSLRQGAALQCRTAGSLRLWDKRLAAAPHCCSRWRGSFGG